jgi:hypothetical protein
MTSDNHRSKEEKMARETERGRRKKKRANEVWQHRWGCHRSLCVEEKKGKKKQGKLFSHLFYARTFFDMRGSHNGLAWHT